MEQHFFRDGFENYLKDSVENFRIYPSGKVWKGIYNSMHPGRRWPSLTVMLLFIFSLLYIGITHSNQVNPNRETAQNAQLSYAANLTASNQSVSSNVSDINNHGLIVNAVNPNIKFLPEKNKVSKTDIEKSSQNNSDKPISSKKSKKTSHWNKNKAFHISTNPSSLAGFSKPAPDAIQNAVQTDPSMNESESEEPLLSVLRKRNDSDSYIFTSHSTPAIKKKNSFVAKDFTNLVTSQKEWMEDFAFHNQPKLKAWKTNVDYEAYVTPSIGYRSLKTNVRFKNASRTATPVPLFNSNAEDPEVDHLPAFNFEAGAVARYHTSSKLLLKFGVQFNYTNYLVMATKMNHSTATSLLLNDLNSGSPYLVSKSSNLSNISGLAATSENNESYELSIPLGLDFRLAGNGNLQWFAGATIQPGLVFGGNSLLLSADTKYYISDNSLRRKWNLNTGIESYLAYKTQSGISILAGPQFRYQVFSSYSNEYSFKENLYNLGLKIGVVKKF